MPFANRGPYSGGPDSRRLLTETKHWPRSIWLAGVAALIAYGSLLPFQFHPQRANVSGLMAGLTFTDGGFGDELTNMAIYIPLGLLAIPCRTARRWWWPWRLPLVFLGALGLSTFLEFGQGWTVGRVGSWIDVRSNAIGAILGATLGLIWSRSDVWWNSLLRELWASRPLSISTAVLLCTLLGYHLLPFDVVRGTADLASSFHRAQWTIHLPRLETSFQPTLANIVHQVWTASWFILLGYLITIGGQKKNLSPVEMGLRILAYGLCFIVLLESLQLFSRVHVFDVASMALRILALFFGTWIAWSIYRRPRLAGPRLVALGGLSMAIMLVLGLAMIRMSGIPDLRAFPTITIVDWPLESLWRLSTLYAILEVMEAFSVYGPLTILLYVGLRRAPGFAGTGKIIWLVISMAGLIEWLRAAGGPHAFDLSEPLLAAAAAWSANRAIPWLSKGICLPSARRNTQMDDMPKVACGATAAPPCL